VNRDAVMHDVEYNYIINMQAGIHRRIMDRGSVIQGFWKLGEKSLKLNLLFTVLDLLTLLAYPIVFVHGKLRQFAKPKESTSHANFFAIMPVAPKR
jgi:hypothetical protein